MGKLCQALGSWTGKVCLLGFISTTVCVRLPLPAALIEVHGTHVDAGLQTLHESLLSGSVLSPPNNIIICMVQRKRELPSPGSLPNACQ